MKRGAIWVFLTCLIVTSLVLASCNNTASTTTATTSAAATTTTTSKTVTTTSSSPISTTSTTTTATTTGNWWDKLGTPSYGGTITLRYVSDAVCWDNYNTEGPVSVMEGYLERMFVDNWTIDPAQWDYSKVVWRPDSVNSGCLAQSWEFPDTSTFVVHLRQGIHWQNLPPVNGREFTSADVLFNLNRLWGLNGVTPSIYLTGNTAYKKLIALTAPDKYTLNFKWSVANPTFILSTLQAPLGHVVDVMAPEVIQAYGPIVTDWHRSVGTGPFILTDFVTGSSATMVRNPNYWGFDERYPKNKLPYVDGIKILIIPDNATALSALRTGKIDVMGNLSVATGQTVAKSSPELVAITLPASYSNSVDPTGGVAPFTDIRVRKAMQQAINLPDIAKNYYSGLCSSDPSTMTSNNMGMGWGFPYKDWPQDLKDSYAYNPTNAKKLLADAGFPNGFTTNIQVDGSADLDLLQIVQSYFSAVGIKMTIQSMPQPDWNVLVLTNHKGGPLTQRSTGYLGMTFDIDRQMQRFVTGSNWGLMGSPTVDDLYAKSVAASSVTDYQAAFNAINKYVAEQNFMISLLTPTVYYFAQPWFKGFMAQDDSVYGGSGPRLMGFYCSRFWIDQKQKASMGH